VPDSDKDPASGIADSTGAIDPTHFLAPAS